MPEGGVKRIAGYVPEVPLELGRCRRGWGGHASDPVHP